jgi:Domain of unknown function (DUF4738)
MKKTLGLFAIFLLFTAYACNPKVAQNEGKRDTLIALKIPNPDALLPKHKGANDEVELTYDDVLSDLRASYGKIEKIDKLVIEGKDTLQIHETYYCLHDSSLRIPGRYLGPWGKDTTKDFIANTFATRIVLVVDNDTILNRMFKKADFDKYLFKQLRRYAIISEPNYIGYDKAKGEFALGYSLSIPLTDVGVPAYITIDKRGKYRVLDEYAKMDPYKTE